MNQVQLEVQHSGRWTFLTNHTHVLVCLWHDPRQRLRDVADRIGISERAVQGMVRDLVEAGILRRSREGRGNVYSICLDARLRHPLESHATVGELLAGVIDSARPLYESTEARTGR